MAVDWQQLFDKDLIEKIVLFILGAIVGGVQKISATVSGVIGRWWTRRKARKSGPEVITVQDHLSPYGNFWNIGGIGDKPAMQGVGNFKVTNRTANDIVLTRVEARIKGAKAEMLLPLVREHGTNRFGDNPLRSGVTADLSIHFFATPVTKQLGETLVADFLFCDQLGNEHWIRAAEFPSKPDPRKESPPNSR